jgi:hypothetical protein
MDRPERFARPQCHAGSRPLPTFETTFQRYSLARAFSTTGRLRFVTELMARQVVERIAIDRQQIDNANANSNS